ncbi:hypothetical protein [Paraburkholderia sp. CI3]|uniref:hypothetical protein n=1 Tax=Paraburkholderia sp. CI3 TaxID=2991060 RepID=UPI003D21257F
MSRFAREKKEGHERVDGSFCRSRTVRQKWASTRRPASRCVRILNENVIYIEYFALVWVNLRKGVDLCTCLVPFLSVQVHDALGRRMAQNPPDAHPGARLHRVDATSTALARFLLT